MFELKKHRGVIFHDTESDAKCEEKLTCDLENYMRNMPNFYQGTQKSENWDYDGILLPNVENV